MEHEADHRELTAAPLPRLGETPGTVRWLGPALGAHNNEIFRGMLGLEPSEIDALQANGVI